MADIREAVRRIVDLAHPEAIYLFGSRARGADVDGSDWDLFVVMGDDFEPGKITPAAMRRSVAGMGMAIDIVSCRRSVFEEKKRNVNSVSRDVAEEGVLLYERQRSV